MNNNKKVKQRNLTSIVKENISIFKLSFTRKPKFKNSDLSSRIEAKVADFNINEQSKF